MKITYKFKLSNPIKHPTLISILPIYDRIALSLNRNAQVIDVKDFGDERDLFIIPGLLLVFFLFIVVDLIEIVFQNRT